MEKIKLRIENLIGSFRLFRLDSILRKIFLLEVIVFIAGLVLLSVNLSAMTEIVQSISEPSRIVSAEKQEITALPAELFYGGKVLSDVKPQAITIDLNLTGIGKVKGIYKASIEDMQGNYYYVREGERVRGMMVKKINENSALLIDKAGNQFTLKLER
jgi:hypothetical protein